MYNRDITNKDKNQYQDKYQGKYQDKYQDLEDTRVIVRFIHRVSVRLFLDSGRYTSKAIPLPVILHDGQQNNLKKWIKLPKDEEDIYHLDIGSRRKHLHDSHKDGGHDQHGRQVHGKSSLKEVRLEEGGGIGDQDQKC